MNKHKKIAIFIAPILMIFGYVASDYYIEYKADEKKIFQMTQEGICDVIDGECILISGDFKINVFDKEGFTTVNSTFPLDSATLFLVDQQDKATAYPLNKVETAYYWNRKMPLRENAANRSSKQKLRLIAKVKGGQYISEFYTQ